MAGAFRPFILRKNAKVMIGRFFRRDVRATHSLPEGRRIYAVGDVHGCSVLVRELINSIDADSAERPYADTTIIFLGDLVDRGTDTKGVLDYIIELKASGRNILLLQGNHEEVLLKARAGDRRAARAFNRIGGRETLLSYGITAEDYDAAGLDDVIGWLRSNLPESHVALLDQARDIHIEGDYLFVHAGIRPRIALSDQSDGDLRWIRDDFLKYRGDHGKMVVHGHSIFPSVDERSNRVGIDTGAYHTGTLTALGLEGARRWYLSTVQEKV